MKNFKELDLIEPLQRAIAAENYRKPTPIQAQAIPPLLEGRDFLGCAQTGTGKTAAFALPVLQQLATSRRRGRPIRALVLTPTRELAIQVAESFETYGKFLKLRGVTIYGGVNDKPQIRALDRGVDHVVATPGRLLDLMGRGHVDLSQVECFVLDEADRMLDMGFIRDIERIMRELPRDRQNMLLSATMPRSIVKLSRDLLDDPIRVDIAPETPAVERIDQSVYFVEKRDKKRLIIDLVNEHRVQCGIVFSRTKHGANRLTKRLNKAGIDAMAIHGNKSQNARQRALKALQDGKIRLLVGTDVAARGIDIDDVTHVFNYDLPNEPEVYVHRIGRTGRAGRQGVAMAFCDESERDYLRDIEKLLNERIEAVEEHDYLPEWDTSRAPLNSSSKKSEGGGTKKSSSKRRRGGRRRGRGRGRGGKKRSNDSNGSGNSKRSNRSKSASRSRSGRRKSRGARERGRARKP